MTFLKRSNLDFLAISLFILRNVVKQPVAKRVALVYFFENQSKTYAAKGLRKYGSSKAYLQCVREITAVLSLMLYVLPFYYV